jgi:large subunit ribosomal protein L28
MPRRCELTGRTVASGNNVSHSNRRTRRTFAPNLQQVTLLSDALGKVRMRVSTRALRSVQKVGGIDAFLLRTDDTKLPPEGRALKRRVRRAIGAVKRPA